MNDSVRREVRSGERHPNGKHSSWMPVTVIIAAFMGGGIGIIVQSWWLFWLSVGLILLGMPASWLVRSVSHTVVAEDLPDDEPPAVDRAPASGHRVRV
jgi:hypothetical protein